MPIAYKTGATDLTQPLKMVQQPPFGLKQRALVDQVVHDTWPGIAGSAHSCTAVE